MEKEKVLKALGYCAAGVCGDCPYEDVENCDSEMCKDAISLLKANGAITSSFLDYTNQVPTTE